MMNLYRLLIATGLVAIMPFVSLAQSQNVGIGTSAPDVSAALDVVSSSKGALLPRLTSAQRAAIASPATGLLVFQTDGTAGYYYNAGTPASPDWQQIATAAGAAITASNGLTKTGQNVTLGGTLTQATTINQGGFQLGLTGGNVGIGTSSPTNRLDIQNVARTGTHPTNLPLYVTGNLGEASAGVEFRNSDGLQGIGFGYNSIYTAGAYTDQNLNLMPRGNGSIGIGTTTPGAKLHVAGGMKLDGSNTLEFGAGVSGKEINAGKIGYQTFTPGTLDIVGAGTSSANRRIRFWNEGGASFAGNVGIGTSNPTQALEVAGQIFSSTGGVRFPDNTVQTTAAAATNLTGDVTSAGAATTYNNVVPATKGGAGTVNGLLKANGAGTVSAATAGTDYLTPTGSGAGLTNLNASSLTSGTVPVGRLASSGTPSASTYLNGAGVWSTPPTYNGSNFIQNQTSLQAGADFNISGSGYVGGYMGVNGRLGIGTYNPLATFHVSGSTSSVRIDRLSNGVVVGDQFGNLSAVPYEYVGDGLGNHTATRNLDLGNWLLVGSGGFNGLGVSSDGKVGIGIAVPEQLLHLNNTSGSTLLRIGAAKRWDLGIQVNPGNLSDTGGEYYDFAIRDAVNNATRLLIDWSTGNVGITGRLGIGTTAPAAKLDLQGGADASGANDPGALAFQHRNGGYRHWVRSRHNATVTGAGNDLDFYLNNSPFTTSSSTPGTGNIHVMTLESYNGTPRAGIGTTAPTATLHVAGDMKIDGTNTLEFGAGVSGKATDAGKISYQTASIHSLSITGGGTPTSGRRIDLNGNVNINSSTLYVNSGSANTVALSTIGSASVWGNAEVTGSATVSMGLSVGTNDRNNFAALHVIGNTGIGSTTPSGTNISYFAPGGGFAANGGNSPVSRAIAAYFEGGQVWVNDFIVAGQLNVSSDRRIKHIIGLSDRASDLSLLNRLRITNYTYIDQVSNTNQVVKKVIAQEVQELLPAAVLRSTQAIPNVYAKATAVTWANGRTTVTMAKPHELPATGGRMRFYTVTNKPLNEEVTVEDAHTVSFASAAPQPALFVYGKYVDDFLSVDYDALSMLNVSATQELARKVEALEKQNAALSGRADRAEAAQSADHAALQTLQEQMARLLGEAPAGTQAKK